MNDGAVPGMRAAFFGSVLMHTPIHVQLSRRYTLHVQVKYDREMPPLTQLIMFLTAQIHVFPFLCSYS
jgi:hypothetical protein